MKVPVGFLAKLWSFVSFLPFFFWLLILGYLKVGNSAEVIGLWPALFIWTYICVAKSKKLGWVLKIMAMIALPVLLVLFPVLGIIGSVLGGIGYGFFAPLIATFEAVRENVKEKFYDCLADGSISTVKGSCTAVRDCRAQHLYGGVVVHQKENMSISTVKGSCTAVRDCRAQHLYGGVVVHQKENMSISTVKGSCTAVRDCRAQHLYGGVVVHHKENMSISTVEGSCTAVRDCRPHHLYGGVVVHQKENMSIYTVEGSCTTVRDCRAQHLYGGVVVHQKENMSKAENKKWIQHYNSSQKILLVGEGDFSFSACLARAFGYAANMVATCLHSRDVQKSMHWTSEEHIQNLEARECLVLYEVDVFDMNHHRDLKGHRFDRIIFNFPHAGHFFWLRECDSVLILKHQDLLKGYFKSAKQMLRKEGEILVTSRTDQPYCRWEIKELAKNEGLILKEKVEFYQSDYPGYRNKRGGGSKSNQKFPLDHKNWPYHFSYTFKFIVEKCDVLAMSENINRNNWPRK